MSSQLPGLGSGSILLHVGVHKTGTTAIQASLQQCRPFLDQWKVRYPGNHRAQHRIATAAIERSLGWSDRGAFAPKPKMWKKFLSEARSYDGITVLSSEFMAESDQGVIEKIVSEIGPENVHVVISLRNLGKIMPSAWQQFLKGGYKHGYEHWLDAVLRAEKRNSNAKLFWARHQHDEVVARWAAPVGDDHVSVIVVDEAVREGVFWDFETILGLPKNTLVEHQGTESNRSMTIAEAEYLRRVNETIAPELQWPEYRMLIRRGLIRGMVEGREPEPDEPKLQTPQWALDAAAEISGPMCDAIAARNINRMGELDVLRRRLTGPESIDTQPVTELPVAAAVAGLAGVVRVIETETDDRVQSKAQKAWKRATNKVKK